MSAFGLDAPETGLLLACCRGEAPRLEKIDWNSVTARATASGLGALLYNCLKQNPDAVPTDALMRSRAGYMAAAAGNLRLIRALTGLLERINARGIPSMLLKGSALVATVYQEDPALRPMSDVDLLIRPEDMEALIQILGEFGMVPAEVKMSAEEYARGHHHWIPYIARDGSLAIELHFGLVPRANPVTPAMDEIWRCGRSARLGELPVSVPAVEHLLLHLAIHACTSPLFEPPLRGLFDMAQTIAHAKPAIDWDHFVAEAKNWNASRQAWVCLLLAKDWMGAQVPAPALARLERDARFKPGERAALVRMAQFLVLRPHNARGANAVQERLFDLVIAPGRLWRKIPVAARVFYEEVLQSARSTWPKLPGWLLPLYAMTLHPVYLLVRRKR